jgi:hypothetical protein
MGSTHRGQIYYVLSSTVHDRPQAVHQAACAFLRGRGSERAVGEPAATSAIEAEDGSGDHRRAEFAVRPSGQSRGIAAPFDTDEDVESASGIPHMAAFPRSGRASGTISSTRAVAAGFSRQWAESVSKTPTAACRQTSGARIRLVSRTSSTAISLVETAGTRQDDLVARIGDGKRRVQKSRVGARRHQYRPADEGNAVRPFELSGISPPKPGSPSTGS